MSPKSGKTLGSEGIAFGSGSAKIDFNIFPTDAMLSSSDDSELTPYSVKAINVSFHSFGSVQSIAMLRTVIIYSRDPRPRLRGAAVAGLVVLIERLTKVTPLD